MLRGSKAESDLSRAEWEEKGVVRMLRMRSLRGFWKRGDVRKTKGVFWRDTNGDSVEEKLKRGEGVWRSRGPWHLERKKKQSWEEKFEGF